LRRNIQAARDLGRPEPVVAEPERSRIRFRERFDRDGPVHDSGPYDRNRATSSVEHHLAF
jgi:hypothetical protein